MQTVGKTKAGAFLEEEVDVRPSREDNDWPVSNWRHGRMSITLEKLLEKRGRLPKILKEKFPPENLYTYFGTKGLSVYITTTAYYGTRTLYYYIMSSMFFWATLLPYVFCIERFWSWCNMWKSVNSSSFLIVNPEAITFPNYPRRIICWQYGILA